MSHPSTTRRLRTELGLANLARTFAALLLCFIGTTRAGDPNAEKLERIPSPEESLAAMTVADGYEINLFASEVTAPLFNPMSMAFDAEGRLWVITSPTYPHYDPGVPPSDKILIFEDTDRDGVADRHTVFADQLYIPTGILPDVNGGCWVGQQPNLWYMQDTDGDLVADRREVVLHGFGTEDSHHSLSAFTWGPDGAFYFNEGVFHHTQVETPYGPVRARDAAVFRYHPGRQRFTVASHRRYNNPWGHAFDRWGQSVLSDASGGRHFNFAHVIPAFDYPDEIGDPAPFLNRGRPMAGNTIISSRHFPDDVQGTHVNNQSIGFHGTRWDRLIESGSGWKHESLPDLLSSTDYAFRPVMAKIGGDGALYILDYCNRRLGHMQYTHRNPDRDHTHGRIWRITAKDRPLLDPHPIVGEPVTALLDALRVHENHVRHFARRELQTRPTSEVEPALDTWVASLDPQVESNEPLLLEAMWIFEGRSHSRPALVERLLDAKHHLVRAAATRVVRHWIEDRKIDTAEALRLLAPRVEDPNQRVRLEAVLACGFVPSAEAAGLALLASDFPMDGNFGKVLEQTLKVLKKYGEPPADVGRRFQLQRMTREALLAEPLDEKVARVRVRRGDLSAEQRREALTYLADRTGRPATLVLLDELARAEREDADPKALVAPLTRASKAELAPHVARVAEAARESRRGDVRSALIASLLRVRPSVDAAVELGLSREATLVALATLPNPDAYPTLYDDASSALASTNGATRRAAMRAMVRFQSRREETFSSLAARSGSSRPDEAVAAKMAMNELPHGEWPEGFEEFQVAAIDVAAFDRGRRVYYREGLCATCHRTDGVGVVGSYPPLTGTPRVAGSARSLARIVLHGLRGPVEVQGQTYRSAMAPLGGVLSDQEVADVLTYVRNAWGNRAGNVTPELVAEVRAQHPSRTVAWTTLELRRAESSDPTATDRPVVSANGDSMQKPTEAGPSWLFLVAMVGAAIGGAVLLFMGVAILRM